jgi:AraC family transcriptional activator FtrA
VTTPGSRPHATAPHSVVAVAFDGMAPFELGVVVEVFGLPRPELDVPWYRFATCSPDEPPLRAVGGLSLTPDAGVEAIATADTVVVPAWPRLGEPVPPLLIDALQRARLRGTRLVSICSGAFVLAAAGLLDGRRAATHWRYAEKLRALHPAVAVDEHVLYVDDGQILTSAGSAAGIDLCLHIVRCDHGSAVANQVARRLVVAPHREGDQAQFIERPVPPPDDDRIRGTMEWALANLDERITLTDLAARSYMSVRTFTRQFRQAVGQTPIAWLLDQRVKASMTLLETTDHPVDWIAHMSGFSDAASFRRHFRRVAGVSPSRYRRNFAAGQQERAA